MKIRYIFFSLVFIPFFISCGSYNIPINEIVGVYHQKEYNNIELRISCDSFVFIDTQEQRHLPTVKYCDTIKFGKWKMEDGK